MNDHTIHPAAINFHPCSFLYLERIQRPFQSVFVAGGGGVCVTCDNVWVSCFSFMALLYPTSTDEETIATVVHFTSTFLSIYTNIFVSIYTLNHDSHHNVRVVVENYKV
jgi:hypothetical protein